MLRFISILTGLFILIFLVSLSLAGIPKLINYQGMLTDNSGNPLTDTLNITFKIYNDPTAGTKKWEETQNNVPVINGLFNVILGSATPIDTLSFKEQYWLDITVGAEHMPTRLRFTSVAYAYRALIADTASVAIAAPTAGGWTDDGSVVRLTTGSDNVGIGTTSPDAPLVISGDGTSWNRGFLFIKNNNNDAGIRLYDRVDSVKHHIFNDNGAGDKLRIAPEGNSASGGITIGQSGNVGIGTTSPGFKLDVADRMRVQKGGSASAGIWLNHPVGDRAFVGLVNDTTVGFWGNTGAGWGMVMNTRSGNVGIGTENPTNKLQVNSGTATAIYATSGSGVGVYGTSSSGYGVYGTSSTGWGVYGYNSNNGNHGYLGTSGYGVSGVSTSGYGVYGSSSSGQGVYGYNSTSGNYGWLGSGGQGVYGYSSSGISVWGYRSGGGNYAGCFDGNVNVAGTLSKTAGGFKIDHPLDPAGKYLYHSFVESPDMMNIYNGNATTDASGDAVIELPEWFEALNRDFRYQLTCIGEGDVWVQVRVAREVEGNHFTIQTSVPRTKVSWQVTGIRKDAYAEAHRIQVEVEKTGAERGKYIHPKEYGVSETLGIDYEKTHEMEEKMKAESLKMQGEPEKK